MMVRPSEFGMVQQMNEASQIKHSEISKPIVEQLNLVNQMQKDTEVKTEQVQSKDDVDSGNRKFDAKDKSNNEYNNDNDEEKKHKSLDGRVFIKGQGQVNFDVKI